MLVIVMVVIIMVLIVMVVIVMVVIVMVGDSGSDSAHRTHSNGCILLWCPCLGKTLK